MIPPGSAGTIRAEIDTAHLRGRVGRGITVTTNDPAHAAVRLTVWATVLASVEILPGEKLAITNHAGGDPVGRLLVRHDPEEPRPLALSGARASVPWLAVETRPVKQPLLVEGELPSGQPGDVILEVRPTEAAPAGTHQAEISFETGGEHQPTATVPVIVSIRPAVSVSVSEVALPPAGGSKEVLVTVRPDLDPRALRVVAEPDRLIAELLPAGTRHYRLRIGWDGAPPADLAGRITLRIGEEHVDLPVVTAR